MNSENSQFWISELSRRILPWHLDPPAHVRPDAHTHIPTGDRSLCHSITTTAIEWDGPPASAPPALHQLFIERTAKPLPGRLTTATDQITGNNNEHRITTHHSPCLKSTSNTVDVSTAWASHQSRHQPAINLCIAWQIQNRQHQYANLSMALPCLGCNRTFKRHCASGPWWRFWWTVDELVGGCQSWIT